MKMRIACFLFLLFLIDNSFGQKSLPVNELRSDTSRGYGLNHLRFEILYDSAGKYSLKDVVGEALAAKFLLDTAGFYNIDPSTKAAWLRFKVVNLLPHQIEIVIGNYRPKQDFYIIRNDGKTDHKTTGFQIPWRDRDGYKGICAIPVVLDAGEVVSVYERQENSNLSNQVVKIPVTLGNTISTLKEDYVDYIEKSDVLNNITIQSFFYGALFLAFVINLIFFFIVREKVYLYYSLYLICLLISRFCYQWPDTFFKNSAFFLKHFIIIQQFFNAFTFIWFTFFIRNFLRTFNRYPLLDKAIVFLSFIPFAGIFELAFYAPTELPDWAILILRVLLLVIILSYWRGANSATRLMIIAVLPVLLIRGIGFSLFFLFLQLNKYFAVAMPSSIKWLGASMQFLEIFCLAWLVLLFSWILFQRFVDLKNRVVMEALEKEKIEREKEIERGELIAAQKIELEEQVDERTAELKKSIEELKSTQAQLIQSEKMASLGELTAGIAHEIQNPLNFVNNFSEVNKELLLEMNDEINKGNLDEVKAIATYVIDNQEKINHHGKRADDIVKGMLQHSRSSSGKKEPTNINALADEYLRLAYHGLRAKDKSFNATLKTDFDESLSADEAGIGNVNIISQDVGRVILNLITNAFYAVTEKKKQQQDNLPAGQAGYEPTVSVSTKRTGDNVLLSVKDNGNGIPKKVLDKIFQPFFTTKPSGQGTGLGLSLSYDIVKAHGGDIKVETREGEGTQFIIKLPV